MVLFTPERETSFAFYYMQCHVTNTRDASEFAFSLVIKHEIEKHRIPDQMNHLKIMSFKTRVQ